MSWNTLTHSKKKKKKKKKKKLFIQQQKIFFFHLISLIKNLYQFNDYILLLKNK